MVKKRDRKRTTPRLRKPPKELTPRQEAFIREYLVDHNGQQAAIRAGYGVRSARLAASRLLTHDNVQAALATGVAKQVTAADLKAQDVLERLIEVSVSPIDWEKIRPEHQLKAVELLAKNLGLLKQTVEICASPADGPLGSGSCRWCRRYRPGGADRSARPGRRQLAPAARAERGGRRGVAHTSTGRRASTRRCRPERATHLGTPRCSPRGTTAHLERS